VDVWIVFRVDVLELGMECSIAGAGQPAGCRVGDIVGLWREALTLDEAAEGFGIAEVFCS
jgi:hypothetical protein